MRAPVILLFLALGLPLLSQNFYGGVGQHLGISSYTRGMVPWQFKMSSNTGLFAGYKLKEKHAFQTGVGYHIAGAKEEVMYNGQKINKIYRQNYLRIPLIIKFKTGRKGRFLLAAGGYFNLYLGHSIRTDPTGYTLSTGWETLDIEKNVFGLLIRPEFELPLYGKTLSIGLQQDVGISKFAPETRPVGTSLFFEYRWFNLR